MSSIVSSIDAAVNDFVADGLELIGTNGFDALVGSTKGDLIDGLGAPDFLRGANGDDLVKGGFGGDFVEAGSGNDIILGQGGSDVIFTGQGNDLVDGGRADDVIFGEAGNDLLFGGCGADTILGDEGNDTLNGASGDNLLFGNVGDDVFEFDAADFGNASVNRIGDFTVDRDSLVIKGLSENDQLSFNSKNGLVSINGEVVINLNSIGDTTDIDVEEIDNGDFELM